MTQDKLNEIEAPAVCEITKEQLIAVRNALWKLATYAISESMTAQLELDSDRLERYADAISKLRLELPCPKDCRGIDGVAEEPHL